MLSFYQALAKRAQAGEKIALKDVKKLGSEQFVTLAGNAQLTAAVEVFGGGVHNVVTEKGILSQLRLVKFLWENSSCFPVIDQLYARDLVDLGIGSQHLISIKWVVYRMLGLADVGSGDRPLREALMLMNTEGVSSLAVVDHHYNAIGNISNVDVKVCRWISVDCLTFIVVDHLFFRSSTRKYLYSFHLRNLVDKRYE